MAQDIHSAVTHHNIVDPADRPLKLARWLLFVAFLVFCMVVVGGITRLTESGLSITEWKPVTGAVPPLGDAAWQAEFERYKQIPEYLEINGPNGMTLSDFKSIYFWEWVHRLLGRLIGLAFAFPLILYWMRGMIPDGYKWRLLGLLFLGGLQGALGWWMVKSGLSVRTDVSHFRLAVHLLTALFILAGLVWTALDLMALKRNPSSLPARMRFSSAGLLLVLFVQLLFGAWVAGLNAGYVASDWPLMQGQFFPAGIDWSQGVGHAFSYDPYLIHFVHRWWAWIAVGALVILARQAKSARSPYASMALHSALGIQIVLGIATVMTGISLPLAVLHQAVGALVVASAAWCAHAAGLAR